MQQRSGPNRVGPRRLAAVPRRRPQAGVQGGHHPGAGRPAGLPAGARAVRRPGVPRLLGHPVRPDRVGRRQRDRAAAHRPAGRRAVGARLRQPRRLRHRARRLEQRLDLPAARRAALRGAGHQLRDRHGAGAHRGLPLRRLAVDQRDRRGAERPLVHHHAAGVVRHLRHRDHRRDQPRAVRPPRGRERARRRLPHRVHLAEVRDVLPRRVHQHRHRLGARDDAVPRRLAADLAVLARSSSCPRAGSRSSGSCSKTLVFIFFFVWLRGVAAPHALRRRSCASAGRCSSRSAWSGSCSSPASAPRTLEIDDRRTLLLAIGAVFAVVLVVFFLLPAPEAADAARSPGTDAHVPRRRGRLPHAADGPRRPADPALAGPRPP